MFIPGSCICVSINGWTEGQIEMPKPTDMFDFYKLFLQCLIYNL